MRTIQYSDFIPQNIAPINAKNIVLFNQKNKKICKFELGNLELLNPGKLLYRHGELADIHLQYNTAQEDFQRALTYLNKDVQVKFICIDGDLTANGSNSELAQYKKYVELYSSKTPVYAIAGNHEAWSNNTDGAIENRIESYTGHPLYYSFEYGNDLHIMLGIKNDGSGILFADGELQWFYEKLEHNRNRRSFVHHHVRPQDGCGNTFGIYNYDIWGGTEATVFENLMKHYKNAHQYHGHSHLKFYLQYGSDIANIDNIFGGWSIHVSSLTVPRDGDVTGANSRQEIYADSEGYIVDVYENGIHLRGRDFVKGEYIPIASYWLDTTLKEIEANTFTDITGTIIT